MPHLAQHMPQQYVRGLKVIARDVGPLRQLRLEDGEALTCRLLHVRPVLDGPGGVLVAQVDEAQHLRLRLQRVQRR